MKLVISEEQYRKLINDKKFINFFNLINESYLSPEEYKMLGVKNAKQLYRLRTERLWDNIFGKRERIYIPYELSQNDIEASFKAIESTPIFKTINEVIINYFRKNFNIFKELTPQEYKDNLIKYRIEDGDRFINKEIRLTKVITERDYPELFKEFVNDKNRISSKQDKLLICISRYPIDIATMSTNRGWTSCMRIGDKDSKYLCLPDEIKNGACVAYLIKGNDKRIENPLARVAIRVYYNVNNPKDLILVTSNKTYPANFTDFREKVHEFINEKMGDIHFANEYELAKGSYMGDDLEKRFGFSLMKDEKFVNSVRNAKELPINTYLFLLKNRYNNLIPNDVKVEGLTGDNIGEVFNYLRDYQKDSFIKNNFNKELYKTINGNNVIDILNNIEDKGLFLKKIIKGDFINTINGDNISAILKSLNENDASNFLNRLTKDGNFINKIDGVILYNILMKSKRPITIFKRLPMDKKSLIKNIDNSYIKYLQRESVNSDSVNKLLKHYNMI